MPNGTPLRVLEDINLAIQPNEVVALLGPSGCGKSTILRILAGLIRPTAGEVLYHGEPLDGLNPGVAIVFQSFALYPWMTVAAERRDRARGGGRSPRTSVDERVEHVDPHGRPGGFEEAYPARAVRRHEAARRHGARALASIPRCSSWTSPSARSTR